MRLLLAGTLLLLVCIIVNSDAEEQKSRGIKKSQAKGRFAKKTAAKGAAGKGAKVGVGNQNRRIASGSASKEEATGKEDTKQKRIKKLNGGAKKGRKASSRKATGKSKSLAKANFQDDETKTGQTEIVDTWLCNKEKLNKPEAVQMAVDECKIRAAHCRGLCALFHMKFLTKTYAFDEASSGKVLQTVIPQKKDADQILVKIKACAKIAPTVRADPSDRITLTKGDNVNLQCRGEGNPVPKISWRRKNNLLPNGEESATGNVYRIQKADRHQAGVYYCTAHNGVGMNVTAAIEVKVEYPPEIEVERGWIHSGEGYEAELACIVHADPPATKVKWYRDTMILDTTESRLMEDRGSRHSLIIRKVQPGDFGNYSCEADNKLGRSKKHIELSGKPNRAVFRSEPVGRMKDAFNITWTVESFSPVEEYRLLYRKKHINETNDAPGEWQEVVIPTSEPYYNIPTSRAMSSLPVPSAATIHRKFYHIRKLEPGVMYEAEVTAKNKYGWAQKSDTFQFNTRSADLYPYESSPQHDVSADPEYRDLGITAASSSATSVLPRNSNVIAILSLVSAISLVYFSIHQTYNLSTRRCRQAFPSITSIDNKGQLCTLH